MVARTDLIGPPADLPSDVRIPSKREVLSYVDFVRNRLKVAHTGGSLATPDNTVTYSAVGDNLFDLFRRRNLNSVTKVNIIT